MTHFTAQALAETEKIKRLNIINSVSGIKSANLIGTSSLQGETNLAIFSSVVHIGSNPPLLGFILRPSTGISRHTYENIQSTGVYTINHVHAPLVEKAHFTSAKFDKGQSEFDFCKLSPHFIEGFVAPFVGESRIQIGLKFKIEIPIPLNDTSLIIGEIEHLFIEEELLNEEGHINLAAAESAGVGGLNQYYVLNKIAEFPYARTANLPGFSK